LKVVAVVKMFAVAVFFFAINGLTDLTWSSVGAGTNAATVCEEIAAMAVSIEEAQEELTPQVMAMPGVVGIAIGECEGIPCIKVMVVKKTNELMGKVPSTFKGHKVAVDEVGEIRGPRPIR
jgi:hypothetical protein